VTGSYVIAAKGKERMVGPNGFEPSTSSVSNHYGFVGEELITN